ncbi:MAG: prenyltransferase/squalene oxidase repeat-containing protein [Gemmataceae bacterium]
MIRLCGILAIMLTAPSAPGEPPSDPTRAAIEKGLRRIEQGAASYTSHRECFSCHHQAMALLSLSSARARGFDVDKDRFEKQVQFTLATFKPNHDDIRKGKSVPGGNTMAAYALFALDAAHHPADDTTQALIEYLLVRQKSDGSWPAVTSRPPTEGSAFTNAALALCVFKAYGPGKDDVGNKELHDRINKAIEIGRAWLVDHPPTTMEDKIFRLRGLVAANVDRQEIARARDSLIKEQKDDGSWSQLPDKPGDAYATGTALMALRTAGVAPADDAYKKGVQFLLKTQNPDGSWLVETRSKPVQTFFDNGDPGGKSQFISFAATGWAVLALLETASVK